MTNKTKILCPVTVATVFFALALPVGALAQFTPPVPFTEWFVPANSVGIDVDSQNNLYVVDRDAGQQVLKFDSNGTPLGAWGGPGTGDGQFSFPTGVAVYEKNPSDPLDDVIVVTDRDHHRIQEFDINGTFLSKFGVPGFSDGQLSGPSMLEVDSAGNVYVTDEAHRFQKFDVNGDFVFRVGSLCDLYGFPNPPGTGCVDPDGLGPLQSGDGQFDFTFSVPGITLDAAGNIYVADSHNWRIQKFTSTGSFVTKWGTRGTGPGQFGITVGPLDIHFNSVDGHLYVTDSANNHRVQVFDTDGNYLGEFGILGGGPGTGIFNSPTGITSDPGNRIYIVDSNNSRVQRWGGPEALLGQLDDVVVGLDLPHGLENSLLSKLESAREAIATGDNDAAVNKLQGFINEVQAQRGKKIPATDADSLITAAQAIIDLLTQ